MTEVREIIDRLEMATAPDRELDAAIFDAFPDDRWPRCAYREENCLTLRSLGREPRYHDGWLTRLRANMDDKYPEDLPRFTASIDAVLTLVERVLPATTIDLVARRKGKGQLPASATIWSDHPPLTFGNAPPLGFSNGHTPAIALCRALLKATKTQADAGFQNVHSEKGST